MFDDARKMLYSADPSVRRSGIVKVANSNDPAAIQVLEEFINREDDRVVREVATKALQYVQKVQWKQVELARASATPPPAKVEVAPNGKLGTLRTTVDQVSVQTAKELDVALVKPAVKKLTAAQREAARSKVNAAFSLQNNGKPDKALLELKQALKLDPDLIRDTFASGMIFSVTGKTGEEARLYLQSVEDNTAKEIANTAVMTGIYFGLELFFMVVGIALFAALFYGKIFQIVPREQLELFGFESFGVLTNPLNLFVLFLPFAISATLATIVPTFMIYIGGLLIGGSGGPARFMQTMILTYAGLYFVIGLIVAFVPISAFTDRQQAGIVLIAVLVASFVTYLVQCYFAGRGHNVGIAKGAVMTTIGNFMTSFLYGWIAQQLYLRSIGQ